MKVGSRFFFKARNGRKERNLKKRYLKKIL